MNSITNHAFIGTVYQWTVLAPSYISAELDFFNKGTGKGNLSSDRITINNTSTVPLVVVFTKFDGQIIQEASKLDGMDDAVKWDKAKENAEITFQRVYLPKVLETNHPPKA